MNSFGPNMTLAKALLEAGQHEVALQYFGLCRVFWKMDRGQLDQWIDEVNRGLCPNFGVNLIYCHEYSWRKKSEQAAAPNGPSAFQSHINLPPVAPVGRF